MLGRKQEKMQKPCALRLYCWVFSMRVSEEERRRVTYKIRLPTSSGCATWGDNSEHQSVVNRSIGDGVT